MMFGTWLAVMYAEPREELPTVCANTSWRPNPMTLATAVSVPMRIAARPMLLVTWRGWPGSGSCSVTGAAGPVTAYRHLVGPTPAPRAPRWRAAPYQGGPRAGGRACPA